MTEYSNVCFVNERLTNAFIQARLWKNHPTTIKTVHHIIFTMDSNTTPLTSTNNNNAAASSAASEASLSQTFEGLDAKKQQQEMMLDEDPLLISQTLTYVTDDGSVLHSFQSSPFSFGTSLETLHTI